MLGFTVLGSTTWAETRRKVDVQSSQGFTYVHVHELQSAVVCRSPTVREINRFEELAVLNRNGASSVMQLHLVRHKGDDIHMHAYA